MTPDRPHEDRSEDLSLLRQIRSLLLAAPVSKTRSGMMSGETTDHWFPEAKAYWKDVYATINRERDRLQHLMAELLEDEDFPPQRSYRWQEGGDLVPDPQRKVIRDLPALLGNIHYSIPGPRAHQTAVVLIEKMIERLGAQAAGAEAPQARA
jgi:hypothetical protein